MSMFASLALSFFLAPASLAQQFHPETFRIMIHLLDYLAQEYGEAIQNGKVVSEPEYAEQKEFMGKVLEIHGSLPDSQVENTRIDIGRLHHWVFEKADADSVRLLAQNIKQKLVTNSGLETFPRKWPDLGEGGKLFQANCTACHGPRGHGDGPAGLALNPKPADFHAAERMSKLSPFQVYNTIHLGVDGTGMPPFKQFQDGETWDLAFYVLALRYMDSLTMASATEGASGIGLRQLAASSDEDLMRMLPEAGRSGIIGALRQGIESPTHGEEDFPGIARQNLDSAFAKYEKGLVNEARHWALKAYLDGIEPLEPRLKALNPKIAAELEQAMLEARAALQVRGSPEKVKAAIMAAEAILSEAADLLGNKPLPPWAVFMMTAGILLREGFEAVLILLAILSVVKVSKNRRAAWYVHSGWILAVLTGFLAWFILGWLGGFVTSAGRELAEGLGSWTAVAVLLYMGFWMHSKSESQRWAEFIGGKVNAALQKRNLYLLGVFSYLVVFREAMETVLFLSALTMEGGSSGKAMVAGVFTTLALVLLMAWLFLRASRNLPLRLLFSFSSVLVLLLAVILAGKGTHAVQEAGWIGFTHTPLDWRIDLVGLFPSYETWISQIIVLALALVLYRLSGKVREIFSARP